MTDPHTEKMLDVVAHVCVEHGIDRNAFVDLIRAGFGLPPDDECPSPSQIARFLFASGDWLPPPRTPDMDRRRAEAGASWAEWSNSVKGRRP